MFRYSQQVNYLLTKFSFLLAMLVCLASNAVLAQENHYHDGFRSFFAKDYEAAKSHWLEGAKQNDPRSMFNLGLLHEQRRISGADLDKARKWYRLAGKHGYPAADYHLSTLLRNQNGTSEEAVQALIKSAAEKGYEPARLALGLEEGKTIRRVPIKPSTKVTYLDETWIKAQNKNEWTIQMLAFEDLTKVKEFIDQHKINKTAAYFVERTSEAVLYKLVYGSYESKEKADSARRSLSEGLQAYGPWLRPIRDVQAALK